MVMPPSGSGDISTYLFSDFQGSWLRKENKTNDNNKKIMLDVALSYKAGVTDFTLDSST